MLTASAVSSTAIGAEKSSMYSVTAIYHAIGILQDQVPPVSYILTFFGLFVKMMQIIGFVFNNYYTYNFNVVREVSYFVFGFAVPIYDREYGPVSMVVNIVVLSVLVVLVIATFASFVILSVKPEFQEYHFLVVFARLSIECFAGWLFIPMIHICLGGLPCKGGNVRNFPDARCGSGLHITAYICGILGMVLSIALATIGCFFFNPDPHSSHILSRPHGYNDFLFVTLVTVALVFFTILLEPGYDAAYSIMMIIISLIMLFSYVLIIPYYNRTVVAIHTGTFSVCFTLAVINVFVAFEVSSFSQENTLLQSTIAFSVIPLSFMVGYLLGSFRINRDFLSKLNILHKYGYSPEHVASFPFPRTFSSTKTGFSTSMEAISADLKYEIGVEEGNEIKYNDETGNLRDLSNHRFEFFVPYISNAYIFSDSELATRFLREFREKTGQSKKYTSAQLLYTLNMYFKSIAYFKRSPYVTVSLGWFLSSYCNRQSAALELINAINNRSSFTADYMVGYKFYRLETLVKESLGFRGTTFTQAYQRATLLHRQAINCTMQFWTGIAKDESMYELLYKIEELSQLRKDSFHQFHLALTANNDDRNALTAVASFIDNVFHQRDIAAELRAAVTELELDKKSRALQGGLTTRSQANEKKAIKFNAISDACQKELSIRLSKHGYEKLLFFGIFYYGFAMATGFGFSVILVFAISLKLAHRSARRMSDVVHIKAEGFRTIYNTQQMALYFLQNNCGDITNDCFSKTEFVTLLQSVSSGEQEMRIRQISATFGENKLEISSNAFDFSARGLIAMPFFTVGTSGFNGLFSSLDGEKVSLYGKLVSLITSIGTPTVEWLASSIVSSYVTTFINKVQKSDSFDHYLEFVTNGGVDDYLAAVEPFSLAIQSDVTALSKTYYTVISLLIFFAILHTFCALFGYFLITEWTVKNRIALIELLRLVPPVVVEELCDANSQALSAFSVSGDSKNRKEEFVESDEEPLSLKEKGKKTAFQSALATVLQSKPGKSCIKPINGISRGLKRTVRFCLTQYDLVEHPRPKLREPLPVISGSTVEIVMDFEKSLEEIEEETKRERALEQEKRESQTERLVLSGYRHKWRNIKEIIASWGKKEKLTLTIGIVFISFLGLVLLALSILFLILTMSTSEKSGKLRLDATSQLRSIYDYVFNFQKSDVVASVFCNFFDSGYGTQFVDYSFSNEDFQSITTTLDKTFATNLRSLVPYLQDLYLAALRPVVSNMIYVVLAARAGYGLNEYDFQANPYLNSFSWGVQEEDVPYLTRLYPAAYGAFDQYMIPALDSAALPNAPAAFFSYVLPLHRRARFTDDIDCFKSNLTALSHKLEDFSIAESNALFQKMRTYLYFVCGFTVIVGIGIGTALGISIAKKIGVFPVVLLSAATLCLIISLILSICLSRIYLNRTTYLGEIYDTLNDIFEYRWNFYRRITYIEQYLHFPNPTYFAAIMDLQPSMIDPYLDSLSSKFPFLADSVKKIKEKEALYWEIQQVSLFLLYAARKKTANPAATVQDCTPPSPPYLSTYDYRLEPNYSEDSIKYGDDHPSLMYSTPAGDLVKTGPILFDQARFAIFGLRGASYFFGVLDEVQKAVSLAVEDTVKSVRKQDDSELRLLVANLVLVCIACLMLIAAVLVPFLRYVKGLVEGSKGEVVRGAVKRSSQNSLGLAIVAVIMFVILYTTLLILLLIPVSGYTQLSEVSKISALRIAGVQESMRTALFLNHAISAGKACLGPSVVIHLRETIDQLNDAREYLYGDSSLSLFGRISTFSNSQRDLLFSINDDGSSVDTVYKNFVLTVERLLNFFPSTEVSAANPNTKMKDIFEISDTIKAEVASYLAQLTSMYPTLLEALEESDKLYAADLKAVKKQTTAPIILIGVLIGLAIIFCVLWFCPLVHYQERSAEENVRPLFASLPPSVYTAIPSLSLFAESGTIDEAEESLEKRYAPSKRAGHFLGYLKEIDDSKLEQGVSLLEELPNASILASETGVIVGANAAALALFQHDSLAGKDLSILMSSEAAEMHSKIMAYYVRNRVGPPKSPSIFSAQGLDKNMETVEVVIVLSEAPLKSGNLYFLAEMFPPKSKQHGK